MINLIEQFLQPLPLGLVLLLLGYLGVAAGLGKCKILGVLGFTIIMSAGMPIVGRGLMENLESQYTSDRVVSTPKADMILVLSGAIDMPVAPRKEFELTHAGDRLLYAFRLFQAGKAKSIMLTGGSKYQNGETSSEADYSMHLLLEMGVPRAALILEDESRDTFQNIVMAQKLIAEQGAAKVLLVTSAAHMPRAMAVAKKSGLANLVELLAAPTDFRVAQIPGGFLQGLVPSAPGLNLTTLALHEYFGWVFYKWKGYL